jgi:DUF1009 family protein
MPVPPKLGLVAGGGDLPRLIAAACREQRRPLFVAAIDGVCDPATVAGSDHLWLDVAAVGRLVEALRAAGCAEVVLAGHVARPDFARLRPDWQGVKLLPRVLQAAARGDDALLRTLVAFLEEQGFAVIGADDVVAGLLAPAGPLGRLAPSAEDEADIRRGFAVVRALGALDVGQAAVVRNGLVLGVEAAEGTDALLARCATLQPAGRGGVLVKLPKPGQERRVDLPVIGVATVAAAAAARLAGIAVATGGALVVDRAAVAAAADAAGLFAVGCAEEPA